MERKFFISNSFDIITARMQAREIAKEMGFGMADQARISLAASELARVLTWNAGHDLNELLLTDAVSNGHRGLQVTCVVNLAYIKLPTGTELHWSHALALVKRSLAGARQLVDESNVEKLDEILARVTLIKWLK